MISKTTSKLVASVSALCLSAGVATADQVFNDDVIVDGSLCVGLDCVNGESFGFDTIRLKENNLRIKFDDTSSSASFPNNDWQITINDSANGGANKFSIDDITGGRTPMTIEAGAPSNSLFVDNGGRVGFGTNNPTVTLHAVTGNTPTLRLEQNGSSGFTPQSWDLAGNETNFFVRDVNNGSTLPLRIRPGAPTSSLDINGSGDIGVGVSSPSSDLHIRRTGTGDNVGVKLESANNNGNGSGQWEMLVRGNDGQFEIDDIGNPTVEFIFRGPAANKPGLDMNGTLTASKDVIAGADLICNGAPGACLFQTSDLRLKPGAAAIENAASIIRDIEPIQWSNMENGTSTGLGAQQVAAVMAKYGIEDWSGHAYNADQDKHLLSYTALVGVLIGAHHEKDQRIAALEAAVQTLTDQAQQ